jgi:EAL and modified HD-GYP domain-containing signal transduction protein
MITKPLSGPQRPERLAQEAAQTPLDSFRYVARQPILDVGGNVHGYELLFRSDASSIAFSGDSDASTRKLLDNSVIFGLERLTGGLPMFVNCTEEALLGGWVKVLPPRQTVLELLETLQPTPALVQGCRELKALGYGIALDDFVWSPAWQPLLEFADYVKVDLTLTNPPQREELKARIGRRPIRTILERVETHDELAAARREGFQLFQGYYFCRPVMLENRDIPANRLIYLEILQALVKVPLDIRQISALVKREPSLTYRLLRVVNSPLHAIPHVVSSIQDALMLVGDEMFRRLAMLATAAELKGDRPAELLRMAFLRGRFCELAASFRGHDPTEQYLLGILSLLPAMLNASVESVALSLPLRREVREALLGEGNAQRTVLDWLLCYETGQWERCDELAQAAGMPDERLTGLYTQALEWAEINMGLGAG